MMDCVRLANHLDDQVDGVAPALDDGLCKIPVYNDNKSAITLSTQYSGAHKRVRYMLTRINWLMEKTKEKVYELLYLSSPELPADFGTKLHTGEKRKTGMDTVMGL